jgi:plastocyanin
MARLSNLIVATGLVLQAHATTIPIKVGNGQLTFDPSSTTAQVGDVLEFHFFPRNHSVVQGSFDQACNPLSGGFFSGFGFPVNTTSGLAENVSTDLMLSGAPLQHQ